MRQFESPPAGSFVPESAPWAVPGRPTSLVIQRVPCALREFQLALLDGKGGVGEWGSGGGCVAVTAIHSPNGAQDDSPRQLAWVTRAKEFTSHVRAAPHATMPLLTEEDWVTRFYHEVAPLDAALLVAARRVPPSLSCPPLLITPNRPLVWAQAQNIPADTLRMTLNRPVECKFAVRAGKAGLPGHFDSSRACNVVSRKCR